MSAAGPLDHAQLVEYLRALAHQGRLELLEILRRPRALPDIRLAPGRVLPGENPDRAISRQAIREHLGKLLEIGLVVEQEADGPGKRGREYVLNQQRLYQILEELRRAGTLGEGGVVSRDETVDLDAARASRAEPGPKLVVVHGLVEGKVFPLRRADLGDGGRGWIVGRRPGLQVSLTYDPYVSLENSEIHHDGREYLLVDLRHSKNGTHLNWVRLDKGGRAPLRSGDVVGVGRSLLVFRET